MTPLSAIFQERYLESVLCFLARGGAITCTPVGGRRCFSDLKFPQGGSEIPCKLVFTGKSKEVEKVKTLFAHKPLCPTEYLSPLNTAKYLRQ